MTSDNAGMVCSPAPAPNGPRKVWGVRSYPFMGGWIEPLQVLSETAQYVTVGFMDFGGQPRTRRRRKDTDIHPTFEAAKAALIARKEREMAQHQGEVHRLNSLLGQLRKLTEPTP